MLNSIDIANKKSDDLQSDLQVERDKLAKLSYDSQKQIDEAGESCQNAQKQLDEMHSKNDGLIAKISSTFDADSRGILARSHADIMKDYSAFLEDDGAIEDPNEPKKAGRKSKFQRELERLHLSVQQQFDKNDSDNKIEPNIFESNRTIKAVIQILSKLMLFSNVMNNVSNSSNTIVGMR